MAALREDIKPKRTEGKPAAHPRPPRTRFAIFGEEIIEKEVRPSGNSGRIYLPLDWVGKHVKVIRID